MQRVMRGIAVLVFALLVTFSIQQGFAATRSGDSTASVQQSNTHKPDHEQGQGNGGGTANQPADPGSQGQANRPAENPGQGQGQAPADLPAPGQAAPTDQDTGEEAAAAAAPDKISVCHATSSATNPYRLIEVSEAAIKGHEHHDGDIIDVESDADCTELAAEEARSATPEPEESTPVASPEAAGGA